MYVCGECGVKGAMPQDVMGAHGRRNGSKHCVCYHTRLEEFYCLECKDFVYSKHLDALVYMVRRRIGSVSCI